MIMKILKKTKKYLHVRMTQEEYDIAMIHINSADAMNQNIKAFQAKYEKKYGTDEYGSSYTYYIDRETGKQAPYGLYVPIFC